MTQSPPDDPAELTNGDLARIFHEIGDILELKGELVFKTVAYHRAADAIGRSPVDVVSAYRSGKPPDIPGVGKAINDKILELATTGHMAYYDRLRAEVPASLVELLGIPGLGPKTVRQINAELGVLTVDDLRKAAEDGRLREPARHVVQDRGARPRGHRQAGRSVRPDATRHRRGEPHRDDRCPGGDARRHLDGAGRLVPPPQGVDRRPRHPGGDRTGQRT